MIILIVKNHLPLQFVENSWLKIFNMHLCPIIFFTSRKQFSNKLPPRLMEKIKQLYVLLALIKCHYATTSFDMWMSKVGHDIFALVINFLGNDCQPKHITLGLFEPTDTTRQTLVKKLTKLLDNYALRSKKLLMFRMRDLI